MGGFGGSLKIDGMGPRLVAKGELKVHLVQNDLDPLQRASKLLSIKLMSKIKLKVSEQMVKEETKR